MAGAGNSGPGDSMAVAAGQEGRIMLRDVMRRLESMGTAQARQTYARHGVQAPCFGVRYADLYSVVKDIGTNHPLAVQLWRTANHDARVVATMIADHARATARMLREWAGTVDNQLMCDAVARLALQSGQGWQLAMEWIESRSEWVAATGWQLIAALAGHDTAHGDREYAALIARIERDIHDSANRVKHTMNNALIGIGLRSAGLYEIARAAAQRIGRVDVDHGKTACKTPDAAAYMAKAAKRGGNRRGVTGAKAGTRTAKTRASKKKKSKATSKKTPARKKRATRKAGTKKAGKKKAARKRPTKKTSRKKGVKRSARKTAKKSARKKSPAKKASRRATKKRASSTTARKRASRSR